MAAALWHARVGCLLTMVCLGATACGKGVLSAPSSTGVGLAWVQPGGAADGRSTSRVGPEPPLRLLWQQSVSAPPLGGARLVGPLLLVLTKAPDIYAFDLASGRRLGRWRGNDPICGSLALSGRAAERLIFATLDGDSGLLALDRRTRKVVWRHAGATCARVVARGDTLFAASESGALMALAAADGQTLWTVDLEGRLSTPPSVADSSVFVGDVTGTVVAVASDSGGIRWRRSLTGAVRTRPAVDATGERLWVATATGDLHALRTVDGEVLWTAAIGGLPSSGLTHSAAAIAVGSSDQSLSGYDPDSGTRRWRLATDGLVLGAPASTRRTVYAGAGDGVLYAVDGASGELRWKYQLDGPVLSPVVLGPALLTVTTQSGTVYLFGGQPEAP